MNAIYARVSTEDQARSGYSLPDQIASCKALLFKQGKTDIVEYVDDGYSGEFIDRPALTNLRDDIVAGRIETVVVYDPDRLARKLSIQLLVAEEMEKAHVSLRFITGDYDSSPEGRLFFSMRGAIAEFEKAKILDRTLRGKKKKASQGKIIQDFGLFGYGFDKENCSYIINEDQAAIVREIFSLVVDKQLSINHIQQELKQRVILSPTGKALWPISSIHNVIRNRTYTGTFQSMKYRDHKSGIKSRTTTERPQDEWISIPVPAIIDEVTFERAQKQLRQNRLITKRTMTYPYLLSGVLYCGICGRRMIAHHSLTSGGVYKPYYQCATQRYLGLRNAGVKCEARQLPAEAIDTDVWDKFFGAICSPEKAKKYMSAPEQPVDYGSEISRLAELEISLIKRRETIAKWFRQQMISEKEAEEELAQIKIQLTDITARKESLNRQRPQAPQATFEDFANKLKPLLKQGNLSPDEKRIILKATLAKVIVVRTDTNTRSRYTQPVFKIKWDLM